MSAEDNKKIVLSFFENLSSGKADAMLAMLADNATWTVMGKPDKFALAGTKTKAQFAELLKGIGSGMPKGLRVTPKALTAEGDRVAMEADRGVRSGWFYRTGIVPRPRATEQQPTNTLF